MDVKTENVTPREFFLYKLSPTEQKLLSKIVQVVGADLVFDMDDIKCKVDISQNNLLGALLTRLVNKGALKRIKRGSYQMKDPTLIEYIKSQIE